jgi:N-acetylmuramoyl-L-alanine amidase
MEDNFTPNSTEPEEPVQNETGESNPSPESQEKQRPAMTTWRMIMTMIMTAFVVATLFTIWTPGSLLSQSLEQRIEAAIQPQIVSNDEEEPSVEGTPIDFPTNRIGLVVGHLGNDSGAVCSNGLREVDVNSTVATLVQQRLVKLGYEVDLLEEFDDRLQDYKGIVLLSIHADSCEYINDLATGFKVASALSEKKFENSTRLVNCISDRYAATTNMTYHYQSITDDMTYYHAFDEINPLTTAAIIEIGFLNLDMEILTNEPEKIADGIVAGVQCYLNNETVSPTPTP